MFAVMIMRLLVLSDLHIESRDFLPTQIDADGALTITL